MTVLEALQRTQGRGAGVLNQASVRYAQTLIQPEESICAAVSANVATKEARFPGVVVLTDQRLLIVCGIPGIKRTIDISLDTMDNWEEKPSLLNDTFYLRSQNCHISFAVDPEAGEAFARQIAVLKGEEDTFDSVGSGADSSIFNPTMIRNRRRAQRAKEKQRAEEKSSRAEIIAKHIQETDMSSQESARETADRLARQLEEAKARGQVSHDDPQAIAARLAAELAAEEKE